MGMRRPRREGATGPSSCADVNSEGTDPGGRDWLPRRRAGRSPRLSVRSGGTLVPLPVAEVRWFEADGDDVIAHTERAATRCTSRSAAWRSGSIRRASFASIARTS